MWYGYRKYGFGLVSTIELHILPSVVLRVLGELLYCQVWTYPFLWKKVNCVEEIGIFNIVGKKDNDNEDDFTCKVPYN